MKPISLEEAESAVKHLRFEEYYQSQHVVDSEPLTEIELEKLGLN